MSDGILNRLEDKVDHISDKISSIDSTLAAQHVSLQEHMRRTSLLEGEVKPLVRHDTVIMFLVKCVSLIVSSELIVYLLEKIKGRNC